MPDETRDRYLATLDQLLPFPREQRAEILEEINAHLDDGVEDRLTEAEAQKRLGSPADLAGALARPEQSVGRVFAAAGAGVRASILPWIYGYVFASLVIFVAFFLTAGMVQLAVRALSVDFVLNTYGGWNSAITALAIAFGLFHAGRAMTDAVSVTGRRLRSEVRPWVAAIGTALAAGVLVLLVDMPQNTVSAVALTLAPAGLALGAYRPDLFRRRHEVPWTVIVGLLLLIPIGLLVAASADRGLISEPADNVDWEHGPQIVGPWWVDPTTAQPLATSSWSDVGHAIQGQFTLEESASLADLRDLRLEAWHSDPSAPWRLDDRYDQPFATAPIRRNGADLTGEVVTTRDPNVNQWELMLTGVGPDGTRYVLGTAGGGNSAFTGSVWDWLVAITKQP